MLHITIYEDRMGSVRLVSMKSLSVGVCPIPLVLLSDPTIPFFLRRFCPFFSFVLVRRLIFWRSVSFETSGGGRDCEVMEGSIRSSEK